VPNEEQPPSRPVFPDDWFGYCRKPTSGFFMKNDTAVFAAMLFDAQTGENVWTGLRGTREALMRDGYSIDPISLDFCPHQWLDNKGYVDLNSARTTPLAEILPHGADEL
jgi:hypothetical protein